MSRQGASGFNNRGGYGSNFVSGGQLISNSSNPPPNASQGMPTQGMKHTCALSYTNMNYTYKYLLTFSVPYTNMPVNSFHANF